MDDKGQQGKEPASRSKNWSCLVTLLGGLAAISILIFYFSLESTKSDRLGMCWVWGMVNFFYFFGVPLYLRFRKGEGEFSPFILHLHITFTVVLLGWAPFLLWAIPRNVFLWMIDPEAPGWSYAMVSAGAIATGVFLFVFRRKFKSCYGLTETVVGVGMALHTLKRLSPLSDASNFLIAFLTASVYLIVRGLTNIEEGLTKLPLDPLACKFHDWLKSEQDPPEPPRPGDGPGSQTDPGPAHW
jgi:hypothetical protein